MKNRLTTQLILALAIAFTISACKKDLSDRENIPETAKIVAENYLVLFEEDSVQTFNEYAAANSIDMETRNLTKEREVEAFHTQAFDQILLEFNLQPSQVNEVYMTAIGGFAARLSDAEVAALKANPKIKAVEPDFEGQLDGLNFDIEELAEDLSSKQKNFYGLTTVGGSYTVPASATKWLWIVDSGVDDNHPDINEYYSYNIITKNNSTPDNLGHGTGVAGVAAAKNNSFGVVGIAAGAKIADLKISNNGTLLFSRFLAALDHIYGWAEKYDVVNLSLGFYIPDLQGQQGKTVADANMVTAEAVMKDLANNRNIVFCIAAGNFYANVDRYFPARVNGKNIYTIAAMDNTLNYFLKFKVNGKWTGSNFGDHIDYIEPGHDLITTLPVGLAKKNAYQNVTGTSFAAPVAAGITFLTGILKDGKNVYEAEKKSSFNTRAYKLGKR